MGSICSTPSYQKGPERMTNEELARQIRAGIDVHGNMTALYEQVRGYIHAIAWKYRDSGIMEDLEQEGFLALYPAVQNYDPAAGVKFLTYADYWIRQKMRRYLAENNNSLHIPAAKLEQIQQYERFCNAFRLRYGSDPSDAEIALCLRVSREEVREIKKNAHMKQVASLNAPMTGSDSAEDTEYMDTLAAGRELVDEVAQKVDDEALSVLLWGYVDNLPGNQPEIIRARYLEEQTLARIAEDQGTNWERIRQEHSKALRNLRRVASEDLRPFLPDAEEFDRLYSMALAGNGVERFNQTWTSSTERTALRL